MGFVFVPLSTMAFATIAPKFRADGTAMFSLVRNMGQGVGISLVTAVLSTMMQVNHAELGRAADGDVAERHEPDAEPADRQSADRWPSINGLVHAAGGDARYLDDFWLMMLLSLVAVPLILLLRGPKKRSSRKPKSSPKPTR